MRVVIPKERIDYDGSQIASLWAFAAFGVQEDTIVGFRGGCAIGPEHMVDLEDLKKGEEIKSVDMVHFIVEHFDSTDLRLAYHRQRLLVSIAREVLEAQGASVERKGDDLFSEGKKLSVSIATVSPVSQKIHLGMNVRSEEYMSLSRIGARPEEVIQEVCSRYRAELEDIEKAMRKSRPVGVYR
ncbi:MAG: DUF366 family protein [Candidatus Hydrothermarchaeota archaeon]